MYFYFMKKLFFNKGSYKKYIKVNCLKLVSGKIPPEKFPPGKFPPIKLLLGEFPPPPTLENSHTENSHLQNLMFLNIPTHVF